MECSKKKIIKTAIQPTKLYHIKDVEMINKKHLLKLKNNIITHDIKTEVIELSSDWNRTDMNYQINQMDNNYPYVIN